MDLGLPRGSGRCDLFLPSSDTVQPHRSVSVTKPKGTGPHIAAHHCTHTHIDPIHDSSVTTLAWYVYSKTLSYTASRSTDFGDTRFKILPKITRFISFWEKTSKIHGFRRFSYNLKIHCFLSYTDWFWPKIRVSEGLAVHWNVLERIEKCVSTKSMYLKALLYGQKHEDENNH